MEHLFFPPSATRGEALRLLTTAEKLLHSRDYYSSKSFAARARDSDPTLFPAEQILAVADTLIAGERRFGNSHADWYAVLRLSPQQGHDGRLVATQYRNLAHILNPHTNKFPLADEAFRLVADAWAVLSSPSRKSVFDKELAFSLHPPPPQYPDPFTAPIHQNSFFFAGGISNPPPPPPPPVAINFPQSELPCPNSPREPQNFTASSGSTLSFIPDTFRQHNVPPPPVSTAEQVNNTQKQPQSEPSTAEPSTDMGSTEDPGRKIDEPEGPNFWTACPYCYYMYEYPLLYIDCSLKCQNCKRAFQGVVIPSPPTPVDGQESFFCCWGFLPLGFSPENWSKSKASWTPFSPMFSFRSPAPNQSKKQNNAHRVYMDDDDDEVYINVDSSDDEDWNDKTDTRKKKPLKRRVTGQSSRKGQSVKSDVAADHSDESSRKGQSVSAARKQPGRVAKGRLDLNVECSSNEIEAEEAPAPKVDVEIGEDDNIGGIGFFEGLDEFLSSLPILNIVGDDDKAVKAA